MKKSGSNKKMLFPISIGIVPYFNGSNVTLVFFPISMVPMSHWYYSLLQFSNQYFRGVGTIGEMCSFNKRLPDLARKIGSV